MITVICEKTGIPFEAENRRRKSHPVVQGWIQKAYDEGWYPQANDAIYGNSARFVEKQSFETIEQFVTYFTQLQKDSIQANTERERFDAQSKRDAAEVKRQRHITNDLLRGRGYGWKRFENDEEDIDMFGAPEVEYTLYSPDHRPVSVKEAMQELAYQDVEFAHKWLASRNIAEEVKRQEEATKKQQTQSEEEQREQERKQYKQEIKDMLLSHALTEEVAEAEAERLSRPHTPSEDKVVLASATLSDDEDAQISICGEGLYFVHIGEHTYTVAEMLAFHKLLSAHHDQLVQYAQKNAERS